jgi:hypothetical protein
MKLESNSQRLLDGRSDVAVLQSALRELVAIDGKIKRAKVATAYIDATALFHFLKHVEAAADGRSGASVEIYVQRSSLQSLCRELNLRSATESGRIEESDEPWRRKLRKALLNEGKANSFGKIHLSVFSVSFGSLFHSKAIFIESNTCHRAIVGSVNLTVNGLTQNEELFVTAEDMQDRKTGDGKFIRCVDAYISKESLSNTSGTICKGQVNSLTELINKLGPNDASSLRSVLIEGRIWYERKELEAFAFPLEIPEKIKKAAENLGRASLPHLRNSVAFSLPVLDLVGLSLKANAIERSRWRRRLCVPTCFGLWAPENWCAAIEEARDGRAAYRRAHLDSIKEKFTHQKDEIRDAIYLACDDIWNALRESGVIDLTDTLKTQNERRAVKWIDAVAAKLSEDQYFELLATGLSDVDVPDVWAGNPGDAQELERTFIESVGFELGRPRLRSLLAQRLSAMGFDSTLGHSELADKISDDSSFLFRPIEETEAEFEADDDDEI